jgi:hypothetical protein
MYYIKKYFDFIREPPSRYVESKTTKYGLSDITYNQHVVKSLVLPATFHEQIPRRFEHLFTLFGIKYVPIQRTYDRDSAITMTPITYIHRSLVEQSANPLLPDNVTETIQLDLLDYYGLDQITPEVQAVMDVFRLKYVTIGKYKIHVTKIDELFEYINMLDKGNNSLPLPCIINIKLNEVPAYVPDFYYPDWFSVEYKSLLTLLGVQYVGMQLKDARTYMVDGENIKQVCKKFNI